MQKIDISHQLLIYRYQTGLKLISPHYSVSDCRVNTGFRLGDILKLPCSIYFLNSLCQAEIINHEGLLQCGIQSEKDALGKSIEHFATRKTAQRAIYNTQRVLSQKQTQLFDEDVQYKDIFLQSLAIKTPWYNSDNKIIGVIGFSIAIGQQSLAVSLAKINALGLLNSMPTLASISKSPMKTHIYLSKRENECLRLYIQGKTAKQIARFLHLSYRTVENYIQNIKTKFKVHNKAELITSALHYFS